MAMRTVSPPGGGMMMPLRRLFGNTKIVGGAALLIALVFPPLINSPSIVDASVSALSYAMLALGLNIVVGYAGLLDLGYAAFYAIGAYLFGMIGSAQFTPGATLNWGWLLSIGSAGIHANFWVFLPIVAIVVALFGVLLGAPTLRLRGDYLAIVTLGFGEIVPDVVRNLGPNNIFGWPDITGGTNSLSGIDQPTLGGLQFSTDPTPWYYLSLAVLVLIVFVAVRLRESRIGRAWIAIREDEVAASCMGINLVRTKLMAFGMGAFFSGFAGMINGSRLGSISPDNFTFSVSTSILSMVVLGGMGSIPGVIIGAMIIALLQFYLLDQFNTWIHALGSLLNNSFLQNIDLVGSRYLIFGVLLVSMMIFRREGIWPSSRRRIELRPDDDAILHEEDQQLYDVRTEKSVLRGE